MHEKRTMTGYPSIDKPWLQYYKPGAEEKAVSIPEGKTIWDVVEEKLLQYSEYPAIEYFGREISRPEFIELVYTWARAFRALGVGENEYVPYFGPFLPDVGAMAFALNVIGACPYFLKLAISPEALAEETKDSKIAIVYSDMWEDVRREFSKDRFERVIFVNASDAMPSPKKQIVSLRGKIMRDRKGQRLPAGEKYLRLEAAKKYAGQFHGEVRAPFVPERPAFITSSSGTTVGGVVKGCVATNESTITQLFMSDASLTKLIPGDRCLTNFPPTASTSLDCLFILPLFRGMTVVNDPRVSAQDFYNQILHLKPNMVISTGSMWEVFFNRLSEEIDRGRRPDLSYAKTWVVGGEGTNTKKFREWSRIVTEAGGVELFSGYGSSELFSATCCEKHDAKYDFSKEIMSVGIPYVGITGGIFDEEGHELGYNQRGELWISSKSAMKCYYNKPELTAETLVDGWIHTGDIAEIDENGFHYIWGRTSEKVVLPDGEVLFLVDVAETIRRECDCADVIVLSGSGNGGDIRLFAHVAWDRKKTAEQREEEMKKADAALQQMLSGKVGSVGYVSYEEVLPYSPTTLKKDKNRMTENQEAQAERQITIR